MPFIRPDSVVQYYELRSAVRGPREPALLLIHSLGTSLRVWDEVVGALDFGGSLLRHDLRGHGLSELGDEAFDVATLARDALGLLDALGIESCVVCGLSVGGLVAQELALAAPSRVRGAVLCGTAARIGTREGWQSRIAEVRAGGVAAVSTSALTRWFSPAYHVREPDSVRGYRCLLERTPREGYLAMLQALCEADLRQRLPELRAPVLVVSGELDAATPVADGRALAELIPGASFEPLPGTSHMMSVEKPRELAALVDRFLSRPELVSAGGDARRGEGRDHG